MKMPQLDEQTIEDMSNFLTEDTRLKLLDKLARVCGKRSLEKVSLRLGIAKPHIYRYFPTNRKTKRTIPNGKTTGKIIRELLKEGANSSVINELDNVELRLRRVTKRYNEWKKEMKKKGLIEDPLSKAAIKKLEGKF